MRSVFKIILLAMVMSPFTSAAIGLTPDQLRMVEQLSPQQKASLAKQYGVDAPTTSQQSSVTFPQTVGSRAVGQGSIEQDAAIKTTDEKMINADSQVSVGVDAPVEKITGQTGSDTIELKRAFSDFVRGSEALQVDTSQLKQFGYELFAGVPSTFAPATDVPVPSEYVLGPGDELEVQLFGQKSSLFTLVVDREGSVSFPDIGPLTLAGMSFSQARAYIAQQVGDKMVGITASISMGKLRSIRVFALGDVERPGSYVVSGLATLSHALFVSGGVKKIGSLRHVQLKRQGKVIVTLDLYDFLLQGDTSKDVRLMPGDVVFVPPIGKTASIAGEVVRPAIYELKGSVDVADMVKLAGGFLPKVYREEALLERINDSGNQSVKSFSLEGKGLKVGVQNGDVIKIFSTLNFEENPVMLIGNVKRPGKYAWKKGMHLSDLIKNESMLLPETYMQYGIVEREAKGNREPEIIRFELNNVFSKNNANGDLLLSPRDKVFVFHRSNFRIAPKISISGSVKTPGEYVLKKNMHLIDVLLAAGGLLRDSDMTEAELYRTDAVTKAVDVIRFDLSAVMSGGDKSNILLKDLDRVVVHSIWEKQQQYKVRVSGEVNHPDEYVFVDNHMRLSDLIFAAGGVTEMAMLHKGEITRYTVVDGEERESRHMEVDLSKALAGDEYANIILQPYDTLTVRRLSNWRSAEHVSILGEVKYAGTYPIEDGEKLTDLLKRAGGFTDKAYLKAAVFTRESIKVEQQKQINDMVSRMEAEIAQLDMASGQIKDAILQKNQQANLAAARRVLEQMKQTKALGRLVIRLQDITELENGVFNLTLKDGDTLHVPQIPDQVMVVGQVYNTTALLYRKNYNVENYLDAAGGPTRMADKKRMYVVRADGYVERVSSWGNTDVYPGDAIVVPENLDNFSLLDSTLDWSRVLMQLGVGIASMKTIGIL